jgi:hypothetical protein
VKNLLSKLSILATLTLIALIITMPANAQTKILRIHVPFEFYAGDNVLPAGDYRVAVDHVFNRVVLLSDGTGPAVFLPFAFTETKMSTPDATTLVFRR